MMCFVLDDDIIIISYMIHLATLFRITSRVLGECSTVTEIMRKYTGEMDRSQSTPTTIKRLHLHVYWAVQHIPSLDLPSRYI